MATKPKEKGNGSVEGTEASEEKSEVDLFILTDHKVKTNAGDEIKVPPLTWGKEVQISKLVNRLLGILVKSGVFSGQVPTEEQLPEILGIIFAEAPDAMTKAASILLGKDEGWVEANLISEEIIALLVPFLKSKRDSLGIAFQKHLGNIQFPTVMPMQ